MAIPPRRPGESIDSYLLRTGRRQATTGETAVDIAKQATVGAAQTATSLLGAVGTAGELVGLENPVDEYARRLDEMMWEPKTKAGKYARVGGRIAGEVVSGGALAKGALKAATRYAPKLAQAALEGTRLQRALASAAVNAPVDVLQGIRDEEGLVLPGRAGSVAENVLFSGASGALFGGKKATKAAEAAEDVVGPTMAAEQTAASGPRRRRVQGTFEQGAPEGASPQEIAAYLRGEELGDVIGREVQRAPRRETDPRRLLTAGTPEVGPMQGQAIPMPPVGGRQPTPRGLLPSSIDTRAKEAGQNVEAEIAEARKTLESMSEPKLKMWLESQIGGKLSDMEAQEMMVRWMQGGKQLTPEQVRSLRGVKAPKMQAARQVKPKTAVQQALETVEATPPVRRPKIRAGKTARASDAEDVSEGVDEGLRSRSGFIAPEVMSTIAGAGLGGTTGAALNEEDRVGGALLGGIAGAALGAGAGRLMAGTIAPSPTDAKAERAAMAEAARRAKAPDLTAESPLPFPANREPLLRRANLPPELDNVMRQRIAEFEQTIKRPVTEADVRSMARDILRTKTPEQIIAFNPKRMTGAESLAALTLHKERMDTFVKKMDEYRGAVGDEAKQSQLINEALQAEAEAEQLLRTVMRGDTEAGRALAARNYIAKQITDPNYWLIKASRIKRDAPLTPEQKETLLQFVKDGQNEKALQFMASLQKSSKLEQVAQLRSAGLLTAIPGRLRDIASTSVNWISDTVQRYPGSFADAALAKLGARYLQRKGMDVQDYQLRSVAAPTGKEFREGLEGTFVDGIAKAAQALGWDDLKQGNLSDWVDYIRRAEIDPEMAKRLDVPSQINIDLFGTSKAGEKANAFLDTYQKAIMRMSGTPDKILRSGAFRAALAEQATLKAQRLGLKGQALRDKAGEFLANADDDMRAEAALIADRITFVNDGRAANAITGMIEMAANAANNKRLKFAQALINPSAVRAAARLVMPFRRTPANILSRALEYAPISGQAMLSAAATDWTRAVLRAAVEGQQATDDVIKAQRRLVELTTKNVTGLGMLALGASLARDGLLTGELPSNPAEMEQWRLEGRQPESILIGGQWFPIARISPYGSMMTLGATLQTASGAETFSGVLGAGADSPVAISRSLLNQPMVTGPKEILEAATGRGSGANETPGGYLKSQLGSFVPSFIAQAARAEGVQRMPQTMGQEITSRLPGLQETAPTRLNVFGEPVEKAGGLLNTMINPLPATRDIRQQDPMVRELATIGANIGALGRGKGEPLEQYQWRQREQGKWLREDLAGLLASPEYQEADAATRREMVDDVVQQSRTAFSKMIRDEYGINPRQP